MTHGLFRPSFALPMRPDAWIRLGICSLSPFPGAHGLWGERLDMPLTPTLFSGRQLSVTITGSIRYWYWYAHFRHYWHPRSRLSARCACASCYFICCRFALEEHGQSVRHQYAFVGTWIRTTSTLLICSSE